MSPRSRFHSDGSSSRLVARSHWPTRCQTFVVELGRLTARCRVPHRTELEQLERPAGEPEPALPVDHTATCRRACRHRDDHEHAATRRPGRSRRRRRRPAAGSVRSSTSRRPPASHQRPRGNAHDRRSRRHVGDHHGTGADDGTGADRRSRAGPWRRCPTNARSPIVTPPPIATPGATWTNSPTPQSWSIDAFVLTIVPAPIRVAALTTGPAQQLHALAARRRRRHHRESADGLSERMTTLRRFLTDAPPGRIVADRDTQSGMSDAIVTFSRS